MKLLCIQFFTASVFFVFTSCKSPSFHVNTESKPWHPHQGIGQLSNEQVQFLGGLEITTDDKRSFGGLSSLQVIDDGKSLMAVSDYSMRPGIPDEHRSHVFWFKLGYGAYGTLKDADLVKTGSIIDRNGTILKGELESIAKIGNTLYGSLDNGRNRADTLWSLEKDTDHNLKFTKPLVINDFPSEYNREGFEVLTECNESGLLLIHEKLPGISANSNRYAWVIHTDSTSFERKIYQSHLEEIKGACQLSTGDVIVMEKTFIRDTGENRIALFHIDEDNINQDTIRGELILETGSRYLDNFEGISSFTKNNQVHLLICSDNNGDWNLSPDGSARQKTLLLLFKLK